MTTRAIDRVFAIGLLLLGAYIIWNAVAYGYMRGTTPGPGFFPFWVGLAIVGLSLTNLIRNLAGRDVLASAFDVAGLSKTIAIVAIVAVFIALTPTLGMLAGSALLSPAIAFVLRPRWDAAFAAAIVSIAVGVPVLCYFLCGVYLQVPLARGVLGV